MTSLLKISPHSIIEWDLQQEVAAGTGERLVPWVRTMVGDERAVPLLQQLAENTDSSPVRLAALEELGAISAGLRADAVERALVEDVLGWKDATDRQVSAALEGGPEPVRAAAACWCRWSGRGSLEGPIVSQLGREEQPPWLARSLIRTLGIVGSQGSLPVLQPFLSSANAFTARTAVGAVVAIGSPTGIALLGKLLYDRRSRCQTDVARAICLLDGAKGAAAITTLAADADPDIRCEALRLAVGLVPGGATNLLLWRLGREETPGVLAVLSELVSARPAVDVLAGVAHGAAQPASASQRTCAALLPAIRQAGGFTDEAVERARRGYKVPEPGPNFAWLQAQDGG